MIQEMIDINSKFKVYAKDISFCRKSMNFSVFKVKISIRIEVLIEHFWISVSMSLPFLQIYKKCTFKGTLFAEKRSA